jgi:plasmid stabilization system protein ParE
MAEEPEFYEINITRNAENDLKEIISYILQESPKTALQILEKLQNRIKASDRFPYRGGYVPELLAKNIKDYHQLPESLWKIIYKIENKTVNILAIIDSRRNLQDILIKKLIK